MIHYLIHFFNLLSVFSPLEYSSVEADIFIWSPLYPECLAGHLTRSRPSTVFTGEQDLFAYCLSLFTSR